MPMVKLVSAQPMAFGKNALLQKRYENQCNHLGHDHRTTQRKIQGVAEQCVVSAYNLLMEAEKHEREKIERGDIKYDSSNGRYSSKPSQSKTRRHLQKVRPMTAGPGTSTPRVGHDRKRPSSATASLGKHSSSVISMIEVDNDQTEESQMSVERRKSALVNSQSSDIQQSPTKNINQVEPQSNSHSKRTSDLHVIIPKKPTSTQNRVRLQLNPSPLKSQDRDGRLLTDRSTSRASSTLSPVLEVKENNKNLHNGKTRRPRTADDFRRKCDEDDMTTYWNKRVTKLLKRWNLEDMSDPFLTNDVVSQSDDNVTPRMPSSPVLEPPTRPQEPQTDASLKTKKFIHTYGSHFRSLLRPNSAPPVTESKVRRRPVKATRQEMASIKADISRRRKQTNAILKKSKHIRNHIQALADWKYEG
ncbi:uncharacterized protein LOC110459849 [Mizuhopecten yessoensis]|uniref:Uncharacterized protein n=1 Tax=Mizuhopecten yessoensis TaxID=6573 RepID=A0A210Q3S2_MIZYE|nr:uncharacterized protein LOC110459849 [Mizuhopecten yessoensis]XP_021367983.1 uncharacterized protein LOC110459849 [Mizuhopecten yessoensis]OWF43352.1 hypothetical protein KP79_PYT10286 [Mizuhopecten yessoensis]